MSAELFNGPAVMGCCCSAHPTPSDVVDVPEGEKKEIPIAKSSSRSLGSTVSEINLHENGCYVPDASSIEILRNQEVLFDHTWATGSRRKGSQSIPYPAVGLPQDENATPTLAYRWNCAKIIDNQKILIKMLQGQVDVFELPWRNVRSKDDDDRGVLVKVIRNQIAIFDTIVGKTLTRVCLLK